MIFTLVPQFVFVVAKLERKNNTGIHYAHMHKNALRRIEQTAPWPCLVTKAIASFHDSTSRLYFYAKLFLTGKHIFKDSLGQKAHRTSP